MSAIIKSTTMIYFLSCTAPEILITAYFRADNAIMNSLQRQAKITLLYRFCSGEH